MAFLIFFVAHWYAVMFFDTFWLHRYCSHKHWHMSPRVEKSFHIANFLVNGSSYLSSYAYGIMHRIHHAFTDTEDDPHSPSYHGNLLNMMWQTRQTYFGIYKGTVAVDKKFTAGVPRWEAFDKLVHNFLMRGIWVAIYAVVYLLVADQWWMWLFFPATVLMGPLHGAIINWCSHRYGYVNYRQKNTSTNLMPLDIFFLGEVFHNNHHKAPARPNLGFRRFEFDPLWPIVLTMEKLRIIRINRVATAPPVPDGPGL